MTRCWKDYLARFWKALRDRRACHTNFLSEPRSSCYLLAWITYFLTLRCLAYCGRTYLSSQGYLFIPSNKAIKINTSMLDAYT